MVRLFLCNLEVIGLSPEYTLFFHFCKNTSLFKALYLSLFRLDDILWHAY
uniref:Uncharacterized protein n=1 Tax=Rhizophora mucronata TaxID=61149 RepID=A0A2P2J3C3_RHIMU